MNKIVVYTDGSCIHNANTTGNAIGPGGYGVAFFRNNESVPFHTISGGVEATTNNRMEIAAFLEALTYIHNTNLHDVRIIYSDSQYVINSWNTWLEGWAKKSFTKIKNPDLWEKVWELKTKLPNITGEWVKGHSGDHRNEYVNDLAQERAYHFKKESNGNIR